MHLTHQSEDRPSTALGRKREMFHSQPLRVGCIEAAACRVGSCWCCLSSSNCAIENLCSVTQAVTWAIFFFLSGMDSGIGVITIPWTAVARAGETASALYTVQPCHPLRSKTSGCAYGEAPKVLQQRGNWIAPGESPASGLQAPGTTIAGCCEVIAVASVARRIRGQQAGYSRATLTTYRGRGVPFGGRGHTWGDRTSDIKTIRPQVAPSQSGITSKHQSEL